MATFTVQPQSDIAPGETAVIRLSDFPAGPKGKRGYLAKRGPFDGVVFDSYASVRLRGEADGMSVPIPADSARTADSQTVANVVTVRNPSSNSSTVAASDIEIILFGTVDDLDEQNRVNELQFSGQAVISDLVPGIITNTKER